MYFEKLCLDINIVHVSTYTQKNNLNNHIRLPNGIYVHVTNNMSPRVTNNSVKYINHIKESFHRTKINTL